MPTTIFRINDGKYVSFVAKSSENILKNLFLYLNNDLGFKFSDPLKIESVYFSKYNMTHFEAKSKIRVIIAMNNGTIVKHTDHVIKQLRMR